MTDGTIPWANNREESAEPVDDSARERRAPERDVSGVDAVGDDEGGVRDRRDAHDGEDRWNDDDHEDCNAEDYDAVDYDGDDCDAVDYDGDDYDAVDDDGDDYDAVDDDGDDCDAVDDDGDDYDAVDDDGDDCDADSDEGNHDDSASRDDLRVGRDVAESWFGADVAGRSEHAGPGDLDLGVIGCGGAGVQYIADLASRSDATVAAISDLSRERIEHVGERYGISQRYQLGSALLTAHRCDLDGVLICSPSHTHAYLAVQALSAGVATYVEPPVAVGPADASNLSTLAAQSTAPAMVGYVRRYDPASHRLEAMLERGDRVHSVDTAAQPPGNPEVLRRDRDSDRGPRSKAIAVDAHRIQIRQAKEALGTDTDWIGAAYLYHLDHLCPDVNLLAARYGDVATIDHASLDRPGKYLSAVLGYEGGSKCHITSRRTDEQCVEDGSCVETPDTTMRVDRSDTSGRTLASGGRATEEVDGVLTRTHTPTTENHLSRENAVTRALDAFLEAIRTGSPTRTPVSDAAKDVQVIAHLISRATDGTEVTQ